MHYAAWKDQEEMLVFLIEEYEVDFNSATKVFHTIFNISFWFERMERPLYRQLLLTETKIW